jgi:hypothetical protein
MLNVSVVLVRALILILSRKIVVTVCLYMDYLKPRGSVMKNEPVFYSCVQRRDYLYLSFSNRSCGCDLEGGELGWCISDSENVR